MPKPNKFQLKIGDVQYSVSVDEEAFGLYSVKVDNETFHISIADLLLPLAPKSAMKQDAASTVNPRAGGSPGLAGSASSNGTGGRGAGDAIRAAMPGTVMTIKTRVGDTVKQGDVLLTLETMKMENPIKSSKAGKIKEISVLPGKFVNVGDMLMIIE
jgi:biotin carboxyl carrier protein